MFNELFPNLAKSKVDPQTIDWEFRRLEMGKNKKRNVQIWAKNYGQGAVVSGEKAKEFEESLSPPPAQEEPPKKGG